MFLSYCFYFRANLVKRSESRVSTLLRILTNYFQSISLSLAFRLNYPDFMLATFTPISLIGQVAQTFLSFDCLVKGTLEQ